MEELNIEQLTISRLRKERDYWKREFKELKQKLKEQKKDDA
jgi:hypothetical protein